jgi:hypothetical protein
MATGTGTALDDAEILRLFTLQRDAKVEDASDH